jgi:Delta3,5-Delta2,4-dienoyl-CoA isomerase
MAADIGTLSRLPKIVSSFSWVKDVCLSARYFGATEALAVGFVSQVHESKAAALGAALKLADLLASKSPVAVQGTKELLNHSRDHPVDESMCSSEPPTLEVFGLTVVVDLRYTSIWNSAALQSTDFRTALLSGMQKTKPRFEKL